MLTSPTPHPTLHHAYMARHIYAAKAKGIFKAARPLSTARRLLRCARKGWALLRSPRPWGASGGNVYKALKAVGLN